MSANAAEDINAGTPGRFAVPLAVVRHYAHQRVCKFKQTSDTRVVVTLLSGVKAIWLYRDGHWRFDKLEG